MKKLTVLALAVSAMTIAAFGMNASAATKLNLSVPDAASSSIGVAAQEFADQLNEKSGGELEVKVFFDGSLYGGDATAAVTTMQDGGLDMLCLATSWYASFDDSFNVIQIPYLFKSVDAEQAYLNDEASQPMWDAVEGMGVKFLAAWTRSFRMTTNNIRPITKPEDFEGIKLRTPGNQIYQVFFGACGANVTPMSFSEVYTALQTNTIDGQENPADVPFSASFYEVQKYISATNHIGEAWVVGMNPDKFASLSEDMQTLILDTAQEMQQWKKDYDEATDQADIDFMVEKGMEYNDLDEEGFAAFQEVSKSLYPDFQAIVNNPDLWDATVAFAEAN
ncbi:MAG: DctP family TRAP transporter solute-binding subunit [Lachnospiraceae bacterium]|nr:DctP family TRAP transporter solute-binding subunit [Lachnospiraceae bacterium]